MDKFRVETIASTPQPQQVVWAAMHQDYSEDLVYDHRGRFPDEAKAGELIVKHLLLGNRGHYGCYDEATEVLTSCGWLNWSKVQKWHNLAAFDPNTQTIKFEVPSALQKYQHHGDVYCLTGQQLDTVVTLDHRMLVKKRLKNGSWTNPYFEYAADVLGKPRRYLKSGYLEDSERHSWTNPWNIPAQQFAMLVGFFVGDGMKPKPANQIRFRLKLAHKIDFLYSLDIPVEAKAGDRYVINLPDIGKWFLDKCYDSNGEKCLPSGYLQLSSLEVKGLLLGLQESDGNVLNKNWRYASTSTNLLDQIQALVHINNLSGNWSVAHSANQKHKTGYYLHISDRLSPRVEINSKRSLLDAVAHGGNPQDRAASHSYQESIQNYNGYVYCATVSTGALIIRRNRKVMVSGNCLEHPQITLNVGYFPHSMMQQIRTHRVGVSFDVQCLAADTEITFVKADGGLRKIKIAELYDLWVNGEKAVRDREIKGRQGELPGKYRRDCKKRLQKMRLRVLNEETKIFETSHLKDVICSGVQPVYRLTLEDGKTLDCTTNHRLFTSEGWQTMAEAVGLITASDNSVITTQKDCFVLCNGITVAGNGLYRNQEWLKEQIKQKRTAEEIAQLAQCSVTTVRDWLRKYKLKLNSKDTKFKKGQKPWNYNSNAIYRDKNWLQQQISQGCHVDEMAKSAGCSVEAIKKWVYAYGLSLNKRPSGTRNPWNKGNSGYKLNLSEASRQLRRKNSTLYTKRGSESHFWKGGTSSERQLIGAWTRQIAPQVHQKFDYICQKCGTRGGMLHAHHLIPVFADESLAYDFNNLVSLCKDCHEFIHHNNLEADFAVDWQPISKPINWQAKRKSPGRKLIAHPIKVIKVEYLGLQVTYDLEVSEPWHNFVANGVVVHNSFRYTGQRVIDVVEGKREIEDVFYLRPIGNYTNRQGKRYFYSEAQRSQDLDWCFKACELYAQRISEGLAEEHARSIIPFDARQHFVVSCNARSVMHLLDLRWKKDAQLEAQKFCELLYLRFEEWMPAVAHWYHENRAKKARLSP